ncbi:MAG: STAS domain-containing protein [Candidatus Electronema sp. V4]|uniref:STAS domain-containing protein n=1 Tax=Candidatus Electronema sp. V4 TaxID=3454756 RepID=UPI0040553E15
MSIEYRENCAIVRYEADRLDAASAPFLRKNIHEQMTEQRNALILDLNAVKFMDSSGLGAVVSLMQNLDEGTDLLLCGAGDNIKSLLRKTHLDGIFPLHIDAESAASTVH